MILLDTDVYTLKAENVNGVFFLHFNYKLEKFTKSDYKELFKQWAVVTEYLKEQGVKAVASLIPKDELKTQKWQTMFGLEPHVELGDSVMYRMVL